MTMPKKKRRNITVDGVLYHYKVSRFGVVIQNTETNEVRTVNRNEADTVLPSYVEYCIRNKDVRHI